MRYAIVSDLHANLRAWNAVLADLREQGADVVVCLGDVVGYGPNPAEVLNAVRSVTNNFVMGNHDAAAVGMIDYSIFNNHARQAIEWTMTVLDPEAKEFLSSVPLAIEAEEILFVHAEISEPGRFDYISDAHIAGENFKANPHLVTFVGHTHLPKIFERDQSGNVTELPDNDTCLAPDNRYIVNVGSVGEPRNPQDLRARYVLYDPETREVRFRRVDFDIVSYRDDLEATTLALRPFFLRVYEQVIEGREGKVSKGCSLVDMRVSHDSAALVDLGQVSGVANLSSSGELLQSARPSRALVAILAVAAILTLGLIGVWLLSGREDPIPPPPVVEVSSEPAVQPTPQKEPPPEVPEVKETAHTPEPAIITKTPDKPEPKPTPKPKPPPPKPKPEPVPDDSPGQVEVAWWRMEDETQDGSLVDQNHQITLVPVKKGRQGRALAPDPIPSNQMENEGSQRLGIWQEEQSFNHFAITKKESFTFECWVGTTRFRSPIFLFGTRSGDTTEGWVLALLKGERDEKISFFYDSGTAKNHAVSEEISIAGSKPRHIAIVWDHATSKDQGTMKVFLDGTRVASEPLPHSSIIGTQLHPFRIGAPENMGDLGPSALYLDELRFTRKALQPHQFLMRAEIQGVSLVKADGRSTDSWAVPGNWEGGKVPNGSQNVIIGSGLKVQISRSKPPSFAGSLVLKKGASLHLWSPESESVIPTTKGRLVMFRGSQLVLRSKQESKLGAIELAEKANIYGGISTNGHHSIRTFTSEISGPGQLVLHGTNGNSFVFEGPGTFSGGLVTKNQKTQPFAVIAAGETCFGKGQVVIGEQASLQIKEGLTNTIADDTGLILEGPKGKLTTKLILDSDETVGRFIVDKVDQGKGVFSTATHPKIISGKGKLTVE